MKRQRFQVAHLVARALIAVLGAVAIVALAPAVTTAAPKYPIVTCNVTIDPPSGIVKAGGTFTVSGTSMASQAWQVSFNGQTRTFHGKTFSTTFRVPTTAHDETLTLKVTCTNGKSLFQIQILGTGLGGGHLPNTGGPSEWWLILAGLAGAIGSFLMWQGRRRRAVVAVSAPSGKHAQGR